MNVYWTDVAGGHLKAIHDYIARDSTVYARRMVDRLTTRSRNIGSFPQLGRVVPEYQNPEIREVFEGRTGSSTGSSRRRWTSSP